MDETDDAPRTTVFQSESLLVDGDRYSISADETPSHVVVTAVAKTIGVDPLSLPPLYGSVDPDAVDGVARSVGGNDGSLQFTYAGVAVTVEAAQVRVDRE